MNYGQKLSPAEVNGKTPADFGKPEYHLLFLPHHTITGNNLK